MKTDEALKTVSSERLEREIAEHHLLEVADHRGEDAEIAGAKLTQPQPVAHRGQTLSPGQAYSRLGHRCADYDHIVADNVDLVRRCFAAISAWDVGTLLSLYHPDVELLPLTGTRVESGGYRGHAGVLEYMEEAQDLWDLLQPRGEIFEDFGDYVLVAGHCRVRGRTSGAESDPTCAWVVGVCDGLIVSHRACSDYAEALDVAGARPAEHSAG